MAMRPYEAPFIGSDAVDLASLGAIAQSLAEGTGKAPLGYIVIKLARAYVVLNLIEDQQVLIAVSHSELDQLGFICLDMFRTKRLLLNSAG